MSEMIVGTTGFVNYIPSTERTNKKVEEAIKKYGEDIVIINGEDDLNASNVFHVAYLLDKFNIEKLGSFHDGISGITSSGSIIHKKDYQKFVDMFNENKWKIWNKKPRLIVISSIKIYDAKDKGWRTFFELRHKEYSNKTVCSIDNFKESTFTF